MSTLFQLEAFFLNKIHIETIPEDSEGIDQDSYTIEISHNLGRNTQNPRKFRLNMAVKLAPEQRMKKVSYVIEADIAGFFEFQSEASSDAMERAVRINGGSVLYGILRGQLSVFSGVFQGKSLPLPVVNMVEVMGSAVKADEKQGEMEEIRRKKTVSVKRGVKKGKASEP